MVAPYPTQFHQLQADLAVTVTFSAAQSRVKVFLTSRLVMK